MIRFCFEIGCFYWRSLQLLISSPFWISRDLQDSFLGNMSGGEIRNCSFRSMDRTTMQNRKKRSILIQLHRGKAWNWHSIRTKDEKLDDMFIKIRKSKERRESRGRSSIQEMQSEWSKRLNQKLIMKKETRSGLSPMHSEKLKSLRSINNELQIAPKI